MPPLKKSKKGKRKSKDPHSSKLKVARTRTAPPPLPPELRGLDTEWWYTFLRKHAESGIHAPPDSPLPLPVPAPFPRILVHGCCIPPNLRWRPLRTGFTAAAAATCSSGHAAFPDGRVWVQSLQGHPFGGQLIRRVDFTQSLAAFDFHDWRPICVNVPRFGGRQP